MTSRRENELTIEALCMREMRIAVGATKVLQSLNSNYKAAPTIQCEAACSRWPIIPDGGYWIWPSRILYGL